MKTEIRICVYILVFSVLQSVAPCSSSHVLSLSVASAGFLLCYTERLCIQGLHAMWTCTLVVLLHACAGDSSQG